MGRFPVITAIWCAFALFVGRLAGLIADDIRWPSDDLVIVLMRALDGGSTRWLMALFAGAATAFAATRLRPWLGIPVAAGLAVAVLTGLLPDGSHVTQDRRVWMVLAASAAALGTAAAAMGRCTRTRWWKPLLVASALPLVLVLPASSIPERWVRDRALRWEVTLIDLTGYPELFEVLRAPGGLGVEEGRIRIADTKLGRTVRAPALILRTGCEARFVAPDEPGMYLRGGVEIDNQGVRRLAKSAIVGDIVLEVEVGGEPVARHAFHVDPRSRRTATRPVSLFENGAVQLPRGAQVDFRVSWNGEKAIEDLRSLPRLGLFELELFQVGQTTPVPATPDGPNLVLVVHDTLRADRSSAYGYGLPTTPNLERLAARGLLYEDASAPSSWTMPSTASILTGLATDAHGVRGGGQTCYLTQTLGTLPEAARERGYFTAAFVGNPLVRAESGFDQGFGYFDAARREFRFSVHMIEWIEDWIAANRDRRFFLYLHLVDTHGPYENLPDSIERFVSQVPEGVPEGPLNYYEKKIKAREVGQSVEDVLPAEHLTYMSEMYDAAVHTGDAYLGRILRALDDNDLTDRTVVAVTSDHGEEFLDHGALKHGQSLFRELTHVPLVIAGPGVPVGERRQVPVSIRHIAPTLARFAGTELHEAGDALDLARAIPPPDAPIYLATRSGRDAQGKLIHLVGLRRGPYVVHLDFAREGAVCGLYDLYRDPAESIDLTSQDPARAEVMSAELLELSRKQELEAPTARDTDERTLRLLRELGYLGDDE